eukprot:5565408-Pleurochrysis_carterae.AAC.2
MRLSAALRNRCAQIGRRGGGAAQNARAARLVGRGSHQRQLARDLRGTRAAAARVGACSRAGGTIAARTTAALPAPLAA